MGDVYAPLGYDMTIEGAVMRHYNLTDDDCAAWWWLYEIYGPVAAFELAQKWGF